MSFVVNCYHKNRLYRIYGLYITEHLMQSALDPNIPVTANCFALNVA